MTFLNKAQSSSSCRPERIQALNMSSTAAILTLSGVFTRVEVQNMRDFPLNRNTSSKKVVKAVRSLMRFCQLEVERKGQIRQMNLWMILSAIPHNLPGILNSSSWTLNSIAMRTLFSFAYLPCAVFIEPCFLSKFFSSNNKVICPSIFIKSV